MSDYDPETLMQSRRGPRGDTDVKRWLRGRSDDECFNFVVRSLSFCGYGNESRALDLATSCIRQPAHALTILRTGLTHPDASSIKFWLAFAVRKLGARKVISEVAALLDSNPTAVDMALYWLPTLLRPTDEASRSAFRGLRDEAHRRGIIRGAVTTRRADGETLFHDVYGSTGA
jgi:hypothetical protein